MIRLNIQDNLSLKWRAIINHYINYQLTPIASTIKSAKIDFYTLEQEGSAHTLYCCDIKGQDVSNDKFNFHLKNTNGKTAITDAVTSTRRKLLLKSKLQSAKNSLL